MEIKEFIATLKKSNFSLAIEKEKLILKGDKRKVAKDQIQAIKSNQYIIDYIKEHKNELIEYLSLFSEKVSFENKSSNISSIYQLSGLQEGMLFHGLYDGGSAGYSEQFVCDLIGPDLAIFSQSWKHLLRRHSILRSAFFHDQFNMPVQCVYREVELPVELLDLQNMGDKEQAAAIKSYEEADIQKGFDFKVAPLMRLGLLRLTEDRYRMIWTSHHILFDGWSLQILMEEFLNTHDSLTHGKTVSEGVEDRYEEYIRYIELIDKEQEKSYWLNYLKGVNQATLLPFIEITKERTKGIGTYQSVFLPVDTRTTQKIESYVQRHRITVNTLMQGVWSFLLHHYTGSSDIVYGVIVSGRPDDLPVIEQRVGMYINTLPLHSGMKEHDVIVTWLHGIQNEQVASRQFQHTPLHEVQGWIGVQGDLFDTILVFENYPLSKVLSSRKWSLQIENVQIRDQTNYPLTILINHAEQIIIRFSYNANLLAEVQVKKISEHFEHVLLQIIENVDGRVSNIKLLTPAEEHQLVVEFNANESLYPKHRGITDLFEEQVSKTPAGTAVVFEGERLSYLQLDERSNQLAHYLRSRGVKEETLVPICIERSLEMIIGILGILKAGGAYVPIDAGYPEERISYMLKDIGCKLVVTTSDYVGVFEKENAEVVCMDRLGDVLRAFSRDKAVNATGPDSLAYVMYTSGSTGKPKGVMVEHRNVVSLVRGIDYVSLSKEDILLSTGSPSFDATTFEYWSMLLNGGQLILCTENKLLDSELLKEEIDRRGVTKMWFTSSWFNQLVETDISVFEGLGTILVGGEKLSEQHIKKLSQTYADVEIINGYGPTENTTFSLTCKISGSRVGTPIPIGRPLSNRSVYVLDEWQRLVPVGVAGELYLGGDGLGRGYLNRPELTAEKFIADPFNKEPGARLYKTGDLGRWLADGNIEYLGRIDDQVKIRGYRIEPGEIESVLMQSGLVSQAVVMAKEDKEGTRRLISYVVPNGVFNKEAMLSYSRSRLPEYMLPSLWVELESVPLTPNGKVDKKSLPEPAANEPLGDKYTAPQNELEVKLTQIWQELLHIPRIGIHDNFFELGGNSLLVMRLGSSIRRQLEMELAIKSLFAHPTIAELAAHLGNQSKELLLPVVDVLPRPERIPLSFSQERLWFIDRLAGSSVQYHVPAVLRLKGKLNREALEGALQTIVNRHEVLRTMIGEYEGRAFQNIKDLNRWQISIVDGSVYKEDPEGLQKNIRQIISKPFDLSKDYMLRADLIVVQEQDHVLVVTMHHIASDGWSISILVKEVKELYEAYKEDRPAQLRPLKIQYADYAIWQRKFLQGEVLERKLDYWKTKLEGVAPLQLQTDYSRDVIQSTRGAIATFNINKELTQLLRKLSQQENATLFMTLLAAFKVLLYRYTGQQDICVGTSIANRPGQEMEELLGFFVNMLALRSEVHSDDFFTAVLQQVKQTTLEAYEHQDIPFEKVVAVIKERDLGRSPLFQVLFVLLNTPEVPELRLGELSLFKEDYEHTTAQFDITFLLTETPVGLRATVEYCTDLYHEQTITRMMGHFQELLSSIVKQPDEKVGLLPMLTKAEEHQLVVEFNANESLYPKHRGITDLFEEQVLKTPDGTAVVFEGERLSYLQLDERSNQLAHYLRSRGVKEETLVPICIERSLEMIIGILGILKAGGAYVPIDAGYPEERISYMLKDIGCKLVVTTSDYVGVFEKENAEVVCMDRLGDVLRAFSRDKAVNATGPDSLAYVMYTSGSTGKPKGVMVEHRNVVSLVRGIDYVSLSKEDILLSTGSPSFDATTFEYWSMLLNGGQLILCTENKLLDSELLKEEIDSRGVTKMWFTSSWFNQLVETDISVFEGLGTILVGGEKLSEQHIKKLRQTYGEVEIINGYGPTENTTFSLTCKITGLQISGPIPIGRPLSNRRVYVLDELQRLVPVGVAGELYLGGDGLGRGYLNRPELTAEKFIADPFNKEPGARLYKTGDLGRWLADGNIEYLGRLDDQVKIRGYRIEPGEIESVLMQSGLVSQAVVMAPVDKEGRKRLVGYIVLEEEFNKEVITGYLKGRLPEYMVPALWVQLEQLPLTPNGKLDKRALPDPEAGEGISTEYTAPRNELEANLSRIWQELLDVESVGIYDNFFELGGDSLLAIRLISAIRRELVVEMPISDIFEYSTIASLAGRVSDQSGSTILPSIEVEPRVERIPLSFSQERLWFIDRLSGSLQYHIPAVLRLKGRLNTGALQYALQTIVDRHEVLRTVIREQDGEAWQYIKAKDNWQLAVIDGDRYREDVDALGRYIQELVGKPFDLSQDDMLRATLILLDKEEQVLVVTMHHIASDGWSRSILVKEVVELYGSYEEGRLPGLPVLSIQYADYAMWQRKYLRGALLEGKISYWKDKLRGVEPLDLPSDYARPAVASTRGALSGFWVDKEISSLLQVLSQREGTTLFMTLLSVFKVFLYRYSGQQDICVGTSVAGRQQQETEGLMGFFINTLALRSELRGDHSFTRLLQQVKATTLEAYEHQEVPFEKVVDAVVQERDMSRNPLFQVLFVLQNTPEVPELRLGQLTLSSQSYVHSTAQFDLNVSLTETAHGLYGSMEYSTDLYSEQTIGRMISHFKELLGSVVREPEQQIGKLPMLTGAEKHQLLVEFNDTVSAYSKDRTVIDLFEEQVLRTPQAMALVFEEEQLSYGRLNERSNRLAHYLRSRGVREETLVPICIEPGIEMIVGILGILKAGGAYVPIDADYPLERIGYILEDTGAGIVVSSRESKSKLPTAAPLEIIALEGWSAFESQPVANVKTALGSGNLAYVIYTSGSTGKPKGVMIEHRSLLNYLLNSKSRYMDDKEGGSGSFIHLSYTFDASLTGMMMPLLFGKSIVIGSKRSVDVFEDSNLLKYAPYDFIKLTPSHLELLQGKISGVNGVLLTGRLVIGGEALQGGHFNYFIDKGVDVEIINEYGPTEATVGCSTYRFTTLGDKEKLQQGISIGKPLDNVQLFVLDEGNGILPVGVVGEICIGGDGLARGYLNAVDLTGEKFMVSPFSKEGSGRLYKTGDLGRWSADGNLEYVGRRDDQVKIRGYRIEPGEIESVLLGSELVSQAVVMARDGKEGSRRLVGYVVASGVFDKEAISAYLKSKLPEYMVPALWVELDSVPLTINGKIDRKALPDPDATELLNNEYVAPRNELEATLAEIWQELLEVEQVGIHDNFFELGGHSLLAIRLISLIRKKLEVEMAISDIFDHPTIALLTGQIEGQSGPSILPPIKVEPRDEDIPLSFSQERLWFIDRLQGSVNYHIPAILRLKGELKSEALSYALEAMIGRHEVLRTVFREENGKASQYVKDKEDRWQFVVVDKHEYRQDPGGLQTYIKGLINERFDLSQDYMLRATLITLDDLEHVLVVTMHHIASDAWSTSIIVREVVELYEAYVENRPVQLAHLEIQYADYSIWQRRYMQGEVLDKKLGYWKEKLQGVAPLQLPADYARPAIQSMKGAVAGFRVDKELSEQLELLGQQQGTTLFMTLLAVFKVLLYRYSGQQDICIGTPIAGRQQQEVEGLIGFFINTLALRSEVNGNASFTELLQMVRSTTLEAYEHQEVPFEKVVDAVVRERDMSRSPLFQVMFMLGNTPDVPELRLGELQLSREEYEETTAKFDLIFSITETAQGLLGSVQYSVELFREQTIGRMMGHFKELLSSIVKQPDQTVGLLPMLLQGERHQLLTEFNNTTIEYPWNNSIIDLFEEQVIKTPDAIAVVFENQQLTYKEFNERSNQLAHYLRSRGVIQETLVPICIERSIEMMIGIMGILKAGGAYVPIDPGYPEERRKYMLEDIGYRLVVTSTAYRDLFSNGDHTAELVCVDGISDAWSTLSKDKLAGASGPNNLAYVIYTSGSTGQPKGVMVEHRNVVSLVKGANYVCLTKEDILLSTGSSSFDATTFEYWGMLLNGGQLILCTENRLLDSELLKEEIENRKVNKMWFTSSWFNQLVDTDITVFERLKTILVGGEKLSEQHIRNVRQTYPDINIVNGYGPTENTTFSLTHTITETALDKSIPIGCPISNRTAYITDQRGELVPIGVTGEICLGGAGLTRGYLNNEALTNQKFVSNIFSKEPGARMYKTGDLGCWLPDGNIEYLGRMDDQVKIRGYRIELGEVESVLGLASGVRQCVVVAREDQQGSRRLVAYVVPQELFNREIIESYLRDKLPAYMVPGLWVELESLPLTSNGKVDRKALPDPEAGDLLGNDYVAPRNELETKLTEMWQELLGVERVGIQDNFFDRGGDSIITIQLVSRARRLGYTLQPKDLFLYQTIAKLSKVIAERSHTGVVAEQGLLTGISKLLPIQQWYFEMAPPAISHFNQSVLLAIDKTVTEAVLKPAVEQIVSQHDALRFKYHQKEGRWQQEYGSLKSEVITEDLRFEPQDSMASLITELSDKYQRSLDIEKGEILRVVWMQTPIAESANRLLIVIHHLAVDGVSWRILLEELERLLTGLINNEKTDLESKSTSYRQWCETLEKYGQTSGLLSQRKYWQQVVNSYQPLAVDKAYNREVKANETGNYAVKLGAEQTRLLLQEVPRAYRTEINDILLSALAITLCRWNRTERVVIGLEGHGREEIAEGIDTSRTVGWFTSHFPVVLQVDTERGGESVIKSVKEQLRRIPDKGLGYGVLKYINKEGTLQGKEPWDIVFNYLGQLDNIVKENKWLKGVRESAGANISDSQVVNEKFSVNSVVQAGELVLNWQYSTKHYNEQTVRNLAADYLSNLDSLIAHCLEQAKYGVVFTSSAGGLGDDLQQQKKKVLLPNIDTKSLITARIGGSKMPLYIVCGGGGTIFKFKKFIEMLDADQPVYVLQQPTDIKDMADFPVDVEGIASRYVAEIMAQNPDGPYALSGHCSGGIVAFEMAKQIESIGKKVNLLAMFDTAVPEKRSVNQERLKIYITCLV